MAALHNQEFSSTSSGTNKSITDTKATAPGFSGLNASLLDSLRITPQEHSLLQDLLANPQPQNIGTRALDVVQSQPNNATSDAYYYDSNWNNYYSNSERNARHPQEDPHAHALGVLAEIADIERAWESWHNY